MTDSQDSAPTQGTDAAAEKAPRNMTDKTVAIMVEVQHPDGYKAWKQLTKTDAALNGDKLPEHFRDCSAAVRWIGKNAVNDTVYQPVTLFGTPLVASERQTVETTLTPRKV